MQRFLCQLWPLLWFSCGERVIWREIKGLTESDEADFRVPQYSASSVSTGMEEAKGMMTT